MKKLNIEGCRRMLEAKRGELLSAHYKTEGIAVERVPDSMEELTLEIERNMAVDTLNRKAALLYQITEALERIAGGEYGVCLACQKAISPKRLAALPWAALCLECQQAAENNLHSDAITSMSLRMGFTG
jgi:DnaK suppressor protein